MTDPMSFFCRASPQRSGCGGLVAWRACPASSVCVMSAAGVPPPPPLMRAASAELRGSPRIGATGGCRITPRRAAMRTVLGCAAAVRCGRVRSALDRP